MDSFRLKVNMRRAGHAVKHIQPFVRGGGAELQLQAPERAQSRAHGPYFLVTAALVAMDLLQLGSEVAELGQAAQERFTNMLHAFDDVGQSW